MVIYIYIYMHTYICDMCSYLEMHESVYIYIYTHIYMYAYISIYTHIYMHIYVQFPGVWFGTRTARAARAPSHCARSRNRSVFHIICIQYIYIYTYKDTEYNYIYKHEHSITSILPRLAVSSSGI
jgi:hypothetical protein